MRKIVRLAFLAVITLASPLPEVQAQGVVSAPGGVAAGGDIRDSTITITGISPEQVAVITEALKREQKLTDEQRQVISDLEGKLGVSAGALRAFFRTLGEAEVPPERQEARLVEIAERYGSLLAQLAAAPGDDPQTAELKSQAKAALDAGDLERADELLAGVQAAQDAALDRQQLEAAATAAQRGQIALTRLRYREAAGHFAAAARRVPPGYEEQAWDYLSQQAAALYRQGDEFGDNPALADSIDRYRALLGLRPRERVPLDWAMTQTDLGTALSSLGEREPGTVRLEEAVEAFRAALQERTRERVPLDWATTQNNLGGALLRLGEREPGAARLEEAVAAFRAALEEWTREQVPLLWALAQNNLGIALGALGQRAYGPPFWSMGYVFLRHGERKAGTARLKEAVEAYRAAQEEWTRERAPMQWAMTQNNLCNALWILGELDVGTARLEEAAAACRAALEEYTRERVPLRWATAQYNLGNALQTLGARQVVPQWRRQGQLDVGTARLEEAVAVYRAALQEQSRERVPLQWAATQTVLGNVLLRLGQLEAGTARLKEAIAAYRAALEEGSRERVPLQWAAAQTGLGNAFLRLGERTGNRAKFEDARKAMEGAFDVLIQAGQEQYRGYFEDSLQYIDWQIAALAPAR